MEIERKISVVADKPFKLDMLHTCNAVFTNIAGV